MKTLESRQNFFNRSSNLKQELMMMFFTSGTSVLPPRWKTMKMSTPIQIRSLLTVILCWIALMGFNDLQAQPCSPDMTPPQAVCVPVVNVYLGPNGQVALTPAQFDGGSTDNCGIASLVISPNVLNCSHLSGPVTVTLTATDMAGNAGTCTSTVFVFDNYGPLVTCPADITVNCNSPMALDPINTGQATALDNCDTSPLYAGYFDTSVSVPGACNAVNRQFVYQDNMGNTGSCTQRITVIDNTPPVITVPALTPSSYAISCDAAMPPMPAITFTDNCNSGSTTIMPTISTTQVSGNPSNCGTYTYVVTRTWLATDACGNTASYVQTVNVSDTQGPTFTGNQNVVVNTGSTCQGNVSLSVMPVDNCSSVLTTTHRVVNTSTNAQVGLIGNGTTFSNASMAVGMYTVTFTSTDPCGNASTYVVNLNVRDSDAPTAVCKDVQISVPTSGPAVLTPAQVNNGSSDACPGALSFSLSQTTFPCPMGASQTYNVNLTVTDVSGNTATCPSVVTVVDGSNPAAICKNLSYTLDNAGTPITVNATDVDNGSNDYCGIAPLEISRLAAGPFGASLTYDCSRIGTNVVFLRVTDSHGNVSTCSSTVTIIDNMNPTPLCAPIIVDLNAIGTYTLTPTNLSDLTAGSTDNCSISNRTSSKTTFSCADVIYNPTLMTFAGTPVTMTVRDPSNNSATCTTTVTVRDVTAPVLTCRNITVNLDVQGNYTLTANEMVMSSTDACGTVTNQVFDGINWVTSLMLTGCPTTGSYSVRSVDSFGNISATCTSTVTFIDNKAPVAICQAVVKNLSITGAATVNATEFNNGSMDACPGGLTFAFSTDGGTTFNTTANYSCSNIGTLNVLLSVTDARGNVGYCSTTLQIRDVLAPIISGPGDVTISCTMPTTPAALGTPTATDNCSSVIIQQLADSFTPATGSITSCRMIHRRWRATDASGNISFYTQNITVQDNTAPTSTFNHPALVGVMNGGSITVQPCNPVPPVFTTSSITASDNCSTPTVTMTAVDSRFNYGVMPPTNNFASSQAGFYNYNVLYTWSITDQCGNSSTRSVSVVVNDTQAPTLNAGVATTINRNTDALQCGAFVTLNAANFYSDCTPASTLAFTNNANSLYGPGHGNGTNNASGFYPKGTSTVTFTVTDLSGNITSNTFTIIVADNEAPIARCKGPRTMSLPTSGSIPLTPADINDGSTDNCILQSLSISRTSLNCADVAASPVRVFLTASDGTNSNTCYTDITVLDNSTPGITCPADITVTCLMGTNPTVTGTPTFVTTCPSTTNLIHTDVVTVGPSPFCQTIARTWTVTNSSSISASCVQMIRVTDPTPPMLSGVPANQTVTTCGEPTFPVVTASDDCGIAAPGVTVTVTRVGYSSNPSMSNHYNYTLIRTWSATNECGQTVSSSQTITMRDETAPQFTLTSPLTIDVTSSTSCFASLNINLLDYLTDCAADAFLTVTHTGPQGSGGSNITGTYAPGTYAFTVTANDPSTITGPTTFSFQLIVRDVVTPTAICQAGPVLLVLDNNGNGTLTTTAINNGSTDNCGITSLTLSPNTFTGANVGLNQVTLTATDAAGNTNSCQTSVMVVEQLDIIAGDVTGNGGTVVNIPVTVDNFQQICGLQFSVRVDNSSVANVTGVSSFGLPGMTASNFTISGNNIGFLYSTPSGGPLNVASGTVLFTIQATLAAGPSSATSPVTINGSPTSILVGRCATPGGTITTIPASLDHGSVTIGSVPQVTISGNFNRPASTNPAVPGTGIGMVATNNTPAGAGSTYSFTVPAGSNVTVTPSKNINPATGINVFDALLVQALALNMAPANASPYVWLAADVDESGSVNVFDKLYVQAISMGSITSWPNGWNAWRFLDAAQNAALPTTGSPFGVSLQPSITLNNVTTNQTNVNFLGFKRGDVDFSANPLALTSDPIIHDRAEGMTIEIEDQEVTAGQSVRVNLVAKNFDAMSAYQLAMGFDPTALDFEGYANLAVPGLDASMCGSDQATQGRLPLIWFNQEAQSLTDGSQMFSIDFTAQTAGKLSDLIHFNDTAMEPFCVKNDWSFAPLEVVFTQVTSTTNVSSKQFTLFQNEPNPFGGETRIRFELPSRTPVTLTITSLDGKEVYRTQNTFDAGTQVIRVGKQALPAAGVYFYQVSTPEASATRRMMVIE